MYENDMVDGSIALLRRDALESAIVSKRTPAFLQPRMSRLLTWVTAIGPSSLQGSLRGSETRSFIWMTVALLLGTALLLAHWATLWTALPAMALLVHGMRSFSSVVGHHMTHGARVLPFSGKSHRFIYNVISAIFLLPSYEQYGADHQKHHAYAAGPKDTDQRFIAYLGARFDGIWPFVRTLSDPVFHYRFFRARVIATLGRGPLWRRLISATVLISMIKMALLWMVTVALLYQIATVLQWSTEHLWGRRPDGLGLFETAAAVTYGRLLIPAQPGNRMIDWAWFWLILSGYAAVRMLVVSGDLGNHDLHHFGKGPWTEASYLRVRTILDGKLPIGQTTELGAMFRVAFQSARQVQAPVPLRRMDDDQMLGM